MNSTSAFNCELTKMYLVAQKFLHSVKGRIFVLYTDSIALSFAFIRQAGKYTPKQQNHVVYLSKFTTDVHHNSRNDKEAVYALSSILSNGIHVQEPQSSITGAVDIVAIHTPPWIS